MPSVKEQYRKAIAELVESVCPYQDAPRQRIYHIGFLQSLLAEIYEEDPSSFQRLKRKIMALRNPPRR
jgi:hypothetical protein